MNLRTKIGGTEFTHHDGLDNMLRLYPESKLYLLNYEDDDKEKNLLTLYLFDEKNGSVMLNEDEEKMPTLIKEIIRLNNHAIFVNSKTGWVNDDFDRNRVTTKVNFCAKSNK